MLAGSNQTTCSRSRCRPPSPAGELDEEALREIVILACHYAGWPIGARLNPVVEETIARRTGPSERRQLRGAPRRAVRAAGRPAGPRPGGARLDETEYVVRGTARSYAGDLPADGRSSLAVAGEAPFVTRCVVRRPADPGAFSGTLVAEWLNVSSGADAAPDWTYLSDEIVRRGHVWVGVSAQYVGVEGGVRRRSGTSGLRPLKAEPRYAALTHPGDAYCYGIFTAVVDALDDGPLARPGGRPAGWRWGSRSRRTR